MTPSSHAESMEVQPVAHKQAAGSGMSMESLSDFQFHQLIALLELQRPGSRPVGMLGDPADEFTRFRATRSLSFGPSDISSLSYNEKSDKFGIRVNFFGLYGPASPLPPFYTEWIIEQEHSPANLEELLDLFNHRMISLLHVIWRKYRYYLRFESGGGDNLSQRFLALCGFPLGDGDKVGEIPRSALLPHMGLMSLYANSAEIVGSIVANFFSVPCRIEEFVLRTIVMDEDSRLKLGRANAILGEDTILGSELEDDTGKFRVVFGPASFPEISPFLPHGQRHWQFCDLMLMINREPLEWDLEFNFEPSSVPLARLGSCRLGWESWLYSQDAGAVENVVCVSALYEGLDTHEWHKDIAFATVPMDEQGTKAAGATVHKSDKGRV